ncbi:zinc finger protein Noc-like [Saccostrea echinata]|uniref:zinc finger protein Noc-like n=1 Tax=Saccostrea echinata TaxID=191078 RepID=UPI002A83165D|nr:zinc finger protein Noc-like [Saccostrea echinata]
MNLSDEMLTTANAQYLHPDYLQPLPTTLDAKKSPLALLAQTCSSIGKDPSPTGKSIIPPFGKKESEKVQEKSLTPDNKRSHSANSKAESQTRDTSSEKPGFRTISSKDVPPLIPISSQDKSKSPVNSVKKATETTKPSVSKIPSHSSPSPSITSITSAPSSRGSDTETEPRESTAKSRSTPETSLSSKTNPYTSVPGFAGLPGFPHGYPGFPYLGHGLPGELPSSIPYPSSLSAHAGLYSSSSAAAAMALAQSQAAALKHASALSSPYVSYTRVRTPSGSTTLVPVCRDPYCNNCQLTMQTQHLSSQCTAPGCSQCAHEKSLHSLSGLGLAGSVPMLPGFPASAGASGLPSLPSSLSSLYPPGALGAPQGLPFVCNWMSGTEYCGKRFTNSEELLQHLRTHTTSTETSSLAAAYGGLAGFPPTINPASHLPTPGAVSPNSIRRSYPTSLSPVSSLLGGNRYHPYKSPLLPGQSVPPLGPYYSPYALYPQRLGAVP